MAKATTTGAAPSCRPFHLPIAATFLILVAASTWRMRVETALNDVPVNFLERVEVAQLEDGTPLRTTYTGVAAIDAVLSYLVVAFVSGPLGLDDGFRLLQIHFLLNFTSAVCLFNVEACRKRNVSTAISFPMAWAMFYQTFGGAPIVALYYFAFAHNTRKEDYLKSGREVSLGYAKAILPSVVLVYCIPTIALFLPWNDVELTQALTAFWQPAPLLVNVAMWIFALALAASGSSGSSAEANAEGPPTRGTADLKYLNRIYLVAFLVSAAAHVGTMYVCLTSSNPQLSLSYVFLPNRDTWKESTTLGLHWIFQWDAWYIFGSALVCCWLSVWDVQRALGVSGIAASVKALVAISVLTVLVGPGATMAAVWYWREAEMVYVEERFRGKPKTR